MSTLNNKEQKWLNLSSMLLYPSQNVVVSVFPAGEIYGGTRSAWDYGPLGVALKENIKEQWWRFMVTTRANVVGVDTSVILPREVWVASGHVNVFNDPLTECLSCHKRFRADHLEEHFEAKHGRLPESQAEIPCPSAAPKDSGQSLATLI